MIPFTPSQKNEEPKVVKDAFGNTLEIPAPPYATVGEYEEAMRIILSCTQGEEARADRMPEMERRVCEAMLRSRFDPAGEIPPEDLFKFPDGREVGAPMLKALFEAFTAMLGLGEMFEGGEDEAVAGGGNKNRVRRKATRK